MLGRPPDGHTGVQYPTVGLVPWPIRVHTATRHGLSVDKRRQGVCTCATDHEPQPPSPLGAAGDVRGARKRRDGLPRAVRGRQRGTGRWPRGQTWWHAQRTRTTTACSSPANSVPPAPRRPPLGARTRRSAGAMRATSARRPGRARVSRVICTPSRPLLVMAIARHVLRLSRLYTRQVPQLETVCA